MIVEETTNSYVMRGINIFQNKELMKSYKEEWPLLISINQVIGNGEEVEIFIESVGIEKFSYILYNGCEYVFEQEESSYISKEVYILKPNNKCKTLTFGRSLNRYEDAKIVLFGNDVSVEYDLESKSVLISTGHIFNGLNSTYYNLHAAISNAVIFAKRNNATTTTTVPPTTTTTTPPTTIASTTNTTIFSAPPTIKFDSCPEEVSIGENIVYAYTVGGTSTEVSSIKFELFKNSELIAEDYLENNSNLSLPQSSNAIKYFYEYSVPTILEESTLQFNVYAINQQGVSSELSCISNIEMPEQTPPDLSRVSISAGYDVNYDIGEYAPHHSTGYINYFKFKVRGYLLEEDSLKSVSFMLTPHEALGSKFIICNRDFDQNIIYPSNFEIYCEMEYPDENVKRFVPYNKTNRDWQGWYRLDVTLVDGNNNSKTIQYCKALRIVGGYQYDYSDTTSYYRYSYYSQRWSEIFRNDKGINKGKC